MILMDFLLAEGRKISIIELVNSSVQEVRGFRVSRLRLVGASEEGLH